MVLQYKKNWKIFSIYVFKLLKYLIKYNKYINIIKTFSEHNFMNFSYTFVIAFSLYSPNNDTSSSSPTPSHAMQIWAKGCINKLNPKYVLLSPTFSFEPCFTQAIKNLNWKNAMVDEFNAFLTDRTWSLVPYNKGMSVINYMWGATVCMYDPWRAGFGLYVFHCTTWDWKYFTVCTCLSFQYFFIINI